MEEKFNILNELKEAGASTLLGIIDNKTCFYLPAGYFDNLPSDIATGIFIKSLPVSNPYIIPAGYFQNLPDIIVEKVQLNSIPASENSENIYTVPEGYFDGFASNILKKIKGGEAEDAQQELEAISPFLSSIPKTNVYNTPPDYFKSMNAGEIVKTSAQQPEVKVVSLNSGRSRFSKWINYAAAACVAVLLSGSGIIYFLRDGKDADGAGLTAQIAIAATNVQAQIAQLSDDEIANYLNTSGNMSVYTNSGAEAQQQKFDFQNILKTVSDEEIQQYLKNAEPEPAGKREEGI